MARKKIILFAFHCSGIGGGSWCLFEILKNLDQTRFEPYVLLTSAGPLVERIRLLGFPVIVDPKVSEFPIYGERQVAGLLQLLKAILFYPRGFRRFYNHCRQINPDVVYLNSSAQFFLPWPAKKAGVKTVVLHNREHWEPAGILKIKLLMKNWMTRHFIDQVFSITECGIKAIGFPEKSAVVRDWPSFDDESHLDVRAALGIAEDQFLILLTGGFQQIKGTRDMIAAASMMTTRERVAVVVLGCSVYQSPAWKLLLKKILCRSSYTESVMQLAARCRNVFLLQPTLQVKAYLNACDVLVAPFRMPHAAKAALEAQFLGKPVVLYDSLEAREYVLHGETGVIVPHSDIRALAAALDDLALHPEKSVQMGERGKNFVRKCFSKDTSMSFLTAEFEKA
jgi:glycosyltransferase involved in cell wall biosynthesis